MSDQVVEIIVGMVPTDHWIVCSGLRIRSTYLGNHREAVEFAKALIQGGERDITVQHVGGAAREAG